MRTVRLFFVHIPNKYLGNPMFRGLVLRGDFLVSSPPSYNPSAAISSLGVDDRD